MRRLLPFSLAAAAMAASLSTSAWADCTCRAQGRQFEQGQAACLTTPEGPRVATCGMVLNNSSWELSQTPCVSSQILPRKRPSTAQGDHHKHKS